MHNVPPVPYTGRSGDLTHFVHITVYSSTVYSCILKYTPLTETLTFKKKSEDINDFKEKSQHNVTKVCSLVLCETLNIGDIRDTAESSLKKAVCMELVSFEGKKKKKKLRKTALNEGGSWRLC